MKISTTLNPLQRRILAVLEEAGEDDIAALTNTVEERVGLVSEIDDMGNALTNLICSELLQIARFRNVATLRWVPLNKAESLDLLTNLVTLLKWSVPDQLWRWPKHLDRAQVLLTKAGLIEARRIIDQD